MEFQAAKSYYTPYTYTKVAEKLFNKNEPDYRQEKNLLSGKSYAIIAYTDITDPYDCPQYNTPDTENRLTDGVYAERASMNDPAWTRFSRGVARSIVFDIGAIGSVSEFRVRLLREKSTNVRLPRNVCFAVSENGVDFESVAAAENLVSDRDAEIISARVVLKPAVRARFVRATFSCPVHVYIDQIEAIGKKDVTDAREIHPDQTEKSIYPDRYCSADQLGGAKDVVLAYFCQMGRAPLEVEHFLPYVGYLNKEGKATDTLFDGYLFLPFVNFLYEGYKKRPLDKSVWQFYMDQQFIEGKNLDALELAAEQVAKDLNQPDLKLKVFFSILYPVVEQRAFGEIDGKMRDFTVLEDRIAALKWLIDEQEERFNAKQYKHLDLSGYYWFTEEIDYQDEQLLAMIRFTTDYIRAKNMITTWIPYFLASGFDDWKNLGFDMACYQPNYAFRQDIPEQRLFDAAATAKLLGMCIELEVGGTAQWNVEHTRNYYAAGACTRYMQDAAHMYYQEGMPGAFYKAYHSEDPELHSMYDDTYRFIKGTYPADGFDIPQKNEETKA